MIAIIGSGPAGVSAAKAFAARGQRVTLIDGGLELDDERRGWLDELARMPRASWPPERVAALTAQPPVALGGVPQKYSYGSDHPYRDVDRWLPTECRGASTQSTLARAGFSTVWGSAILPYLEEDLADWPIGAAELAPHYRAVAEWMPVSARRGDLDQDLPLHTDAPDPLPPSAQARALIRDLERHRERLRRAGISYGWSRLAVRASASADGPGCIRCGLCMSGCPHRLIYDTSQTLEPLVRDGLVELRGDHLVERFGESETGVRIEGRRMRSGERFRIEADRLIVACGVVATTRLVLASLERYDRAVEIKDSQYFLLPLLRLRGIAGVRDEELHTLSQLFVELRDTKVSSRNVHLQIYGFNDLYVKLFDRVLGPLSRPLAPAVDLLLSRLMLIQGYLHSNESPSMLARLTRRGEGDLLVLEEKRNPATRPVLRRLVGRLLRHAGDLRAVAAFPALRAAAAGRGFHSGGSFPMRSRPGELECDRLGRLTGFERVHLVDSSVFPTIPSTTITYSVMANAHRIASRIAAGEC